MTAAEAAEGAVGLDEEPSAGCGQLYGVDAAEGSLVRIDAATGASALVGSLGIGTGPVGIAFDPAGRLWALGEGDRQPDERVLYRVDTETGRATVRTRFDLSEDPRPLGTGVALEWGPDGSRLFWASDSYLSILDIDEGRVAPFPSAAPLPFRANSLALPGRCRDLVSHDPDRNRLMRIGAADGAVEDIGPTGLEAPVEALAAGADGSVYGVAGGWLHRFDLSTGRATELVALDRTLSSLAFRPAVIQTFCLDKGYDPKTRLSRYVVRTKGDVRHVGGGCPRPPCGRCGADGYYEMKKNSRIVLAPPRLAVAGRYRLSVQARTTSDQGVGLDARLGSETVALTVRGEAWRWTEPVEVRLDAGTQPIELRAHGRVQIERVRLEQRCFEPCAGEKVRACLDSSLSAGNLSLYVKSVEGRAGHARQGSGCCGSQGYYFLAGGATPGRIRAEVPVPRTGRYLFRFQYRVGTPGQRDEAVRVSLGGRAFDFRDRDLENTKKWEWSPRLEVGLAEGLETIEFVGLGSDSVHLEAVRLDRACECGGEDTPLPAPPADLAATAVSSTAVSLAWTASPSPTVTGYAVYRDQVRIGTSPTTSFDDQGLDPSTSYVYAVTALDHEGRESAPSNELLVTTGAPVDATPPTPPGTPSGVALSASQVHLRWTASTDPASPPEPTSGVAGYRLVRNGQLAAVLGVVTSFTDRGLSASTTYDYALSAFDAAGNESAVVVLPPLRTLDPAVGEKAIGPAGGEVLTQDGRARLVVPQGALDHEIALTIREVEPPDGFVGPVYEIGPSGTRFVAPVRIELSHAGLAPTGVSLSSLRVARLEGDGRPLLNDAGMDPVRRTTSGTTTHLSPHGLVPSVDLFDYVIPSCSAPSDARGGERRTIPIVDPRFPQPADPGRQRGHVYYLKSADGTGFEEWAVDARYIYILTDTTWARGFRSGDQPSCDETGCTGEADCDFVCGSTTCARRWRCDSVPEEQWGAFPDTQVCSALEQPGGTLQWAHTRYYCKNDPAAHGEGAACPEGSLGGHWLRRDVADGDAFTTAFRVKAAGLYDCDEGCTAIEPPSGGSVEGDSSHAVAVAFHATWTAPGGAVFGPVHEDTDDDGVEEELPGVIQVTFGGGGGGEKYWYAHGAGLVASQRGDAPLAYYEPSPGASIPSSPDEMSDCNQSGHPFTADATALCAARAAGLGQPPPPVEAHPLCRGFDPEVPTCTDDRLVLCAGGQPTLATHGCIPQALGEADFSAPDPADPAICTPGTPTPPVGEGTPSGPKYAAARLPDGFGLRLPFAPQKRVNLLKTYGAAHGPNFWTAIPDADTSHCGLNQDCLACRPTYCDPLARNCPHCSHVVLHKRVAESGKSDDYYALDLALDEPDNGRGSPVVAAADGDVAAAGWATGGGGSFGQAVVLKHTHTPSGRVFYSLYAHLDSVSVTATDGSGNPVRVNKGDTVGTLGSSGCLADDQCSLTYWDSAHVHFALYEATDENPVVVSGGISYGGRSVVPEPIDGYTCLASLQGGEPLVADDLEPPPACGWRPASYYNWGQYIGHETRGELAFAMDGDPGTSFDAIVPSPVGSVYGPRLQVTFRPLPGAAPQRVEQIRIRLHVGGTPVSRASVLLGIANVSGMPPLLDDAAISDGQVLTWTNTLPAWFQFDEFIVQIDAWRYFNNGALNKPIGFAEVEVLGSCEGTP